MVQKFKFENGNDFFYLERSNEDGIINNVLVLSGGGVLFLKTERTLELWKEDVQKDLESLDSETFSKKYNIPCNIELIAELKKGFKTKDYPRYKHQ